MRSKKGFTLIELLAVIVILAIILIVAVPKVLDIIKTSREKAWEDSARIIERTIEMNANMIDPLTNIYKFKLSDICTENAEVALKDYVDVGDMSIVCTPPTSDESRYVFSLTGKNEFNGKSAIIKCDGNASCEIISIIVR